MSSEFLDIILFGVVAVFLIMRLKNILGSNKGKIINIKSNIKIKPAIIKKTPSDDFLNGASTAYELIVNAYQSNNINSVKNLLTTDAETKLNQNKSPLNVKLMTIKSSRLVSSQDKEGRLINIVNFESEHYDITENKQIMLSEEWGFEKDNKSSDPNWKLFSISVV